MPALAAFAAWLASFVVDFFSKGYAIEVIKFIAYKALLLMLFFGLTIVMRQFVLDFALESMQAVATRISGTGGLQAPILSLSGGVGAAASYLRIPDCVSVLVSGYTVAFLRSLLPMG